MNKKIVDLYNSFKEFVRENGEILYLFLFLGVIIPISYLNYTGLSSLIIELSDIIYPILATVILFLFYLTIFIYLPLFLLQKYAETIGYSLGKYCRKNYYYNLKFIGLSKKLSILPMWSILILVIGLMLSIILPEDYGKFLIIVTILCTIFVTPIILWLQIKIENFWVLFPFFMGIIGYIGAAYYLPEKWVLIVGIPTIGLLISLILFYVFYNRTNYKKIIWKYNKKRTGVFARFTICRERFYGDLFKYCLIKNSDGVCIKKDRKIFIFDNSIHILFIFNLYFISFIIFWVLDFPSVIFFDSINETVENINFFIYRILIIILFIYQVFANQELAKPRNTTDKIKNESNRNTLFIFIGILFLYLFTYLFTNNYPSVALSSMRWVGLVEKPNQAALYTIDNRYMKRHGLQEKFTDYRKIFVVSQTVKSLNEEVSKNKLNKLFMENNQVLYGYMIWNTHKIKILCPISESMQKDISSKCLHIPSEYINNLGVN